MGQGQEVGGRVWWVGSELVCAVLERIAEVWDSVWKVLACSGEGRVCKVFIST